ncbi:hypothetical protein [Halohasta litchfieldiae]|uniref:hypothetical protein n=1 Tax=Halohasta litchfieldiae TaxID=1073996 RepID=UPI0013A552B6|nr:hypothetical protein [Halohasta litchfieldiae]
MSSTPVHRDRSVGITVDVVEASATEEGIRRHIQREEHDGGMETVAVEEIE